MSNTSADAFMVYLRLRALIRYAFIVTCLIGGFSLERIWPDLEVLGAVAEPRAVLAYILAGLAVLGWCGGVARPFNDPRIVACGLLFLGLHAYVAASYLWSVDPWFARQQLEDLSLLVLTLLAFIGLFGDAPLDAVRIVLQVSVGLAAIVGVLWAMSGFEQGAFGIGGIGAARLFGLACLSVLFKRYESGRAWLLLLIGPLIIGMLVSGSRASLLALLPAMALLWFWRSQIAGGKVENARGSIIGAACALLVVGALASSPAGSEVAAGVMIAIFGSSSGGVEGVYLADRDVIFAHAWSTFLNSPLAGLGIGTYRGPFGEEYPHNLLLTYAIDAGIGALILIGVLLAIFLLLALRSRTPLAIAGAAIALFTLVASLFAGSYYDARMLWLMGAVLMMQAWIPGLPQDRARLRGRIIIVDAAR